MKQTIKIWIAAFVLLLAISCKKENISVQMSSITSERVTQDILTDDKDLADNSVKIGTQIWMTKNLNVNRYRNGDTIPQVKHNTPWLILYQDKWCLYNNERANGAVYGKLYNWYAINDPRGLAPPGWHIPSDAEWTTLITFLGGETVAGSKMKETGNTHWFNNLDATNSSGFTALPGGYRNDFGKFSFIGSVSHFASSTASGTTYAWYRNLGSSDGSVYRATGNVIEGFSVRCVKD